MNELFSGPREAICAATPGAVHLIVDSKHANKPELTDLLGTLDPELTRNLFVHRSTQHINALVRALAAVRTDRVIAVGDDELVNQAVGGLMSVDFARRPALGIVPLASPAQIARGAGISMSFARALNDAVVGTPRPVDVTRWGGRWFLDLVCGGALAETSLAGAGLDQIMGGLAYAVAGVLGLPAMRPVDIVVRGESFAWSGSIYALAIGNTRASGGFCLCPDASIADGELDVTLIPASLDLTDVLDLIDERSVVSVPAVRRFRSPWVEIRARSRLHLDVDGVLRPCWRARFDLARGGLRLVLPSFSPLLDPPKQ